MTATARSMTGFGSAELEIRGVRHRLEIRSVNHRFLDLKLRLPRSLQGVEAQLRSAVQARCTRGALDLKLERLAADVGTDEGHEAPLEVHLPRARQVLQAYRTLATELGLSDSPTLRDIALFPEVLRTRGAEDIDTAALWSSSMEPALTQALDALMKMRAVEGEALSRILTDAANSLRETLRDIARRRTTCEEDYRRKITQKIEVVFTNYPLATSTDPASQVRSVLESRLAQELALILDRTDIQEELHRFEGHLDHFQKTLQEGASVGRKLEFILQELGREINTLGNKAQDFGISEQVVGVKVRLEQMREQVMNLE